MRIFGRVVLAATAAFLVVTLAEGQQPGQPPFGGAGGGQNDALSLLRNASVKKELGVTDEQMEKVPAAVLNALGAVLDEKQMKRLRQIELQQRGTQAFLDAKVQKDLGLSAEQVGNIKTILEDSRKETAELFKDAKGNFNEAREKMATARKEAQEKVQSVLTSAQQNSWKQMLGDEFKIERTFGGGFTPGKGNFKGKGGFKGKDNKKTDL